MPVGSQNFVQNVGISGINTSDNKETAMPFVDEGEAVQAAVRMLTISEMISFEIHSFYLKQG